MYSFLARGFFGFVTKKMLHNNTDHQLTIFESVDITPQYLHALFVRFSVNCQRFKIIYENGIKCCIRYV